MSNIENELRIKNETVVVDDRDINDIPEEEMINPIKRFMYEFDFLSNYYEVDIVFDGIVYKNSESIFQSYKVLDPEERKTFANCTAAEAKSRGKKVKLRSDWEQVKDTVMYNAVKAKFMQNTEIRQKLIDTGDRYLIEGNYWRDQYWGVCAKKGKNKLGKILMKVRDELK